MIRMDSVKVFPHIAVRSSFAVGNEAEYSSSQSRFIRLLQIFFATSQPDATNGHCLYQDTSLTDRSAYC